MEDQGLKLTYTLRNGFFKGSFTFDKISDDEMLEGFRSTGLDILKERYKVAKEFNDICQCYYGTPNGFKDFLLNFDNIRKRFTSDDFIKLLSLSIDFYDSKEFKLVAERNPEAAKNLYESYLNSVVSPLDFDIYGSKFDLRLQKEHLYEIFSKGDEQLLLKSTSLTDVDKIEIVYRHYSHLLPNTNLIARLMDIFYQSKIRVYTHDTTTTKIINKCKHAYGDVWSND